MNNLSDDFNKSLKEAVESIKDTDGMSAYAYYNFDSDNGNVKDYLGNERSIKIENISYGDAFFRNFDLREVFIDGKSKGEFYVKLRYNNFKVHYNAALFLASKLNDCEVDLIDPENKLKLEFHIYIKTKNDLMIEAMVNIMNDIDKCITNVLSER